MNKIVFKKLDGTEIQYKTIYDFCSCDFVYKYFEQRELSYDEIVQKYKKRLRKNAHTKTLIINYDGVDIGVVQYSKVLMDDIKRFNLYNYIDCYQLDIFIGNKDYLHKGIGKDVLLKLMAFLKENYNINYYVAFIEKDNVASLKCFDKLGFIMYKEFKQNNSLKVKTDYCLVLKK